MALDVQILNAHAKIGDQPVAGEKTITLDDDGYYWQLYPFFNGIAVESGQMIDLYGDARFTSSEFETLIEFLEAAKRFTNAQPDEWGIVSGVQIEPSIEAVVHTVARDVLRSLIDKLIAIAQKARAINCHVACVGD